MVERVAVEHLVDPAPRGIAPDRLPGELPRDGDGSLMSARAAPAQRRRRDGGEPVAAGLVERVEVAAAVVLGGGPRSPLQRGGDVVGGKLPPVDEMADVVEEGPIGPAGVRRRRAGQAPGGGVEPGPDDRQSIVERGLVRPVVA